MIKIAIVIGSTRPGRVAEAVGKWVYELAKERGDAQFELVDIKDFNLPLLDEPVPPSQGKYSKEHTKKWSAKIASFDGFVFVTPEYNHGISARLRTRSIFSMPNGITRQPALSATVAPAARAQWKAYGSLWRSCKSQMYAPQVSLSLHTDFENFTIFKPASYHEKSLNGVFDQVVAWSGALKAIREKSDRTKE